MKNQFFYTVKHTVAGTDGAEDTINKAMASFNVEKVIRSMEIPNGNLIVILDDFHEENVSLPNSVNPNTHKVIHGKKEKQILQSEIHLSPEDKERFYKLTNIE